MSASEFSAEEIQDFMTEAKDMLDEAERHLLGLEGGSDFTASYDAVFRVFHSIKGAAGMLAFTQLESHMHQLENQYQQCQKLDSLPKESITYFLAGVDAARHLMEGQSVQFDYGKVGLLTPISTEQQPTPFESPTPATSSTIESTVSTSAAELIQEATDLLFEHYPDIESWLIQNRKTTDLDRFQEKFRSMIEKKQSLQLTN